MAELSKINAAAELVKQHARVFEAIIAVGAVLSEIADAEHEVQERRTVVRALNKERDDVQAAVDTVRGRLAEANAEVEAAYGRRDQVLAETDKEAAAVLEQALAKARVTADEATAYYDAIHLKAADAVKSHDEHMRALGVAREAAQGKLDAANQAIIEILKGRE